MRRPPGLGGSDLAHCVSQGLLEKIKSGYGSGARFGGAVQDYREDTTLQNAIHECQGSGVMPRMVSPERREESPGWLLDEVVNAGRENLDVDHASRYDAKEDAAAGDELILLRELGLNRKSSVVDIGAGTGQFALAAASVCDRVVAVDVSPAMLKVLENKLAESDRSNVEIVQAGFLTYQHRGDPADVVYSRYALHHLPDFWKSLALERVRRILRPDGLFRLWDVVYSFDPQEAKDRLEEWCGAFDDGDKDGWTRSDVEEHIRDEHSTYTWLLEPMMERSGFEIEEVAYSSDGVFARYVARAI